MRRCFHAPHPCIAFAAFLLFALALAGNQSASAAPADQTFGGNPLNPFPALFPELTELPAPAWLKEGLRVLRSNYPKPPTLSSKRRGSAGRATR